MPLQHLLKIYWYRLEIKWEIKKKLILEYVEERSLTLKCGHSFLYLMQAQRKVVCEASNLLKVVSVKHYAALRCSEDDI
jgi:hypothetical protein